MSYDLVVFESRVAPLGHDKILDWFSSIMEEGVTYDTCTPLSTSSTLRAFYDDMRVTFPPMNGPDANESADWDEAEIEFVTGYDFHPAFIYMDFRWPQAVRIADEVFRLAEKHGLGLFDPQDERDGVMLTGGSNPTGKPVPWWSRLFR